MDPLERTRLRDAHILVPAQEMILPGILAAVILMMFSPHQKDSRLDAVKPYDAKLERMAHCESTDNWFANTGNGFYGGLQFDLQTWRSVGGRGYPHQNSELEQKYRAVKLIKTRGYRPWPVC